MNIEETIKVTYPSIDDFKFTDEDILSAQNYANKVAPKPSPIDKDGIKVQVIDDEFRLHLRIRGAFLNGIRYEREKNKGREGIV